MEGFDNGNDTAMGISMRRITLADTAPTILGSRKTSFTARYKSLAPNTSSPARYRVVNRYD